MSDSLWPHGLWHTDFPVLCHLLEFAQTHVCDSVMPSNCLILCYPLLLLPSVFPSIRVFSNELAIHIRWLKYWNFSVTISPSNEYSRLIYFSVDCLDLLAKRCLSFLQHHSLKVSFIWHSAFFYCPTLTTVHDYWKTTAIWVLVSKVMSLHFNTLSGFVITFLPRTKSLFRLLETQHLQYFLPCLFSIVCVYVCTLNSFLNRKFTVTLFTQTLLSYFQEKVIQRVFWELHFGI